jgi:hypothetical protein
MMGMNENQLMTRTSNGSQASTSTPQQSTTANNITPGSNTSSLQPGTSTSLLNNKTGVEVGNTALTYVNLAPRTAAVVLPQDAIHQATTKCRSNHNSCYFLCSSRHHDSKCNNSW